MYVKSYITNRIREEMVWLHPQKPKSEGNVWMNTKNVYTDMLELEERVKELIYKNMDYFGMIRF